MSDGKDTSNYAALRIQQTASAHTAANETAFLPAVSTLLF